MAIDDSKEKRTLFRRLTKLFRTSPVVRRKIKGQDTTIAVPDNTKSSGALLFQKAATPSYAAITGNAYSLAERLPRFQDYNSMEECLHGDTLIAVPGGYKKISELAAEGVDNEFIVYSYDHNEKKVVPALAKQARQTCVKQAYKVTFDNGQYIIGTALHRLLKRDGHFCEIQNLKSGDAMMPFYRRDLSDKKLGYQWIYTMDKITTKSGWKLEHKLLAEWIIDRRLTDDEVVHHINKKTSDNSLENLVVMTKKDHKELHRKIGQTLGQRMWDPKNSEWIERFKKNHSEFMKKNNPAERRDITFGKILDVAIAHNFDRRKVKVALDASHTAISTKLKRAGYKNWSSFASAYKPDWKNNAWNNEKTNNSRYDHSLTVSHIYNAYQHGMRMIDLANKLNSTPIKIKKRLEWEGYQSYKDFQENYQNLKVVSVEDYGVIPLYDLTVDGYKNFATDTVVSHNTPEISAMLDIVADETVAVDEKGIALHIFSNDEKIKSALDDLFNNVLNIEFNLRPWARNLAKFGDVFLLNDVHPEHGVIRLVPIPINEIEREENYDRENPFAVRFRWVTLGNRVLENWEVAHMRLLGNDAFLPYGSSMIEAARKTWRQLLLAEDAMLVYRVVRAPERRVFYIDVGNLAAEEVDDYMQKQKQQLRTSHVIDRATGRVDLRYNPLNVEEDYFLVTRGQDTGTKIDTLAGGQNAAAIDDVTYLQRKMISALKTPRSYLGYDEDLSSKSSLAQLDIRFSRTISVVQKTIISELNKVALIHLFALGFRDEELKNFTLHLSNPSTVAQQQKLELWRAKAEIANSFPDGAVSMSFLRKEILGLTPDQIKNIDIERLREKVIDLTIESAGPKGEGEGGSSGGGGGGGGTDLFGGGGGGGAAPGGEEGGLPGLEGGEEGGGGETGGEPAGGGEEAPEPNEETPGEENAGDRPEDEEDDSLELLTSAEDKDDRNSSIQLKLKTIKDLKNPVNTSKQVKRAQHNAERRKEKHRHAAQGPNQLAMLDPKDHSASDVHDAAFLKSFVSNPLGENDELSWEIKNLDRLDEMLSREMNSLRLSPAQREMLEALDKRLEKMAREIAIKNLRNQAVSYQSPNVLVENVDDLEQDAAALHEITDADFSEE